MQIPFLEQLLMSPLLFKHIYVLYDPVEAKLQPQSGLHVVLPQGQESAHPAVCLYESGRLTFWLRQLKSLGYGTLPFLFF